VGENGRANPSDQVLSGAYQPDSGTIEWNGRQAQISGPGTPNSWGSPPFTGV
jgi:ABC-type uncharacterized transport system ATPase subunit